MEEKVIISSEVTTSDAVTVKLKRSIHQLLMAAPSDANAHLSISNEMGLLKITSKASSFQAEAPGGNLSEMMEALTLNLTDQFESWKQHRKL